MWLSQILWKAFGFGSAYIKNFRDSGFDLLRGNGMTRSQLGRFYWVNLILCAFVLYDAFRVTHQLQASEILVGGQCYPSNAIAPLAFFILAEVGSFVLFLGGQVEAWIFYRQQGSASDHAILKDVPTRKAAARRLHRLWWTWFPLVLWAATYLSSAHLDDVGKWCVDSVRSTGKYDYFAHHARLLWASVWPGLIVTYAVGAAVNWAIYRWSPSRKLAITVAFGFVFYVMAVAVVGPADMIGLANLCRQLPIDLGSVFKFLAGGG